MKKYPIVVPRERTELRFLVPWRTLFILNIFLAKGLNVNLGEALQFLREYDREASSVCSRLTMAQWNFATNITDANRRRMVTSVFLFFKKHFWQSIFWQVLSNLRWQLEEQTLKLKFERSSWRKAVTFAWTRIPDPLTRRQLKMIVVRGRNALTDDKFNEVRQFYNSFIFPLKKMTLRPHRKKNNVNKKFNRYIIIMADTSFDRGDEGTLYEDEIVSLQENGSLVQFRPRPRYAIVSRP